MVNMKEVNKTIEEMKSGKISVKECNDKLLALGCDFGFDFNKNKVVFGTVSKIQDYTGDALLDAGIGTKHKIHVEKGKIDYIGDTYALVIVGDKYYHVKNGTELY